MSFAFFNALFPDVSSHGGDLGFVVLALFPQGRYDPDEGPTQNHFFSWPSQRDDLVAFCLHNTDKDIYTVPALFKERGNRRAGNIAHQWCAYADADSLNLAHLHIEPTLVVETSPHRHHLYWVTNTDDPARLVEISRTIAHTHGPQGCDTGGWDAGQLLRVPGTANNKPPAGSQPHDFYTPFEVTLLRTGSTYDIDKLQEAYPPTPTDRQLPADLPPLSTWHFTNQSIAEANGAFTGSPSIYSMFSEEILPGQDRSATLYRLLSELSRAAISQPTALHIAWEAKCNKFRRPTERPDALQQTWCTLRRAYEDPANQPVTNSIEADERHILDASDANPANKVREFISGINILTPEEREQVPANTFIDRYSRWAQTRTDAPPVYHRAVAVTLLSCIFGEFGSCPTKFDANLTLWFLLLGPTTRARKSTAMLLGVDLLTELQDSEYHYLIGSDVTSEALSGLLPKRNGWTSFFYRDEAHGLLYEVESKRHFAGLQEHMTDLYGGRVRRTLRASNLPTDGDLDTSGNSGNVRTNFVMFLCGTMDQVTSALTLDDYQSGHLARFLVADADPPPMTEEEMWIEQYDGVDRTDDTQRLFLLNSLQNAREHWRNHCGERGNTRIIPFATDAWARLMKARWTIYQSARQHEMAEVLLPTTDRMGTSLMKCAVLIAMSEEANEVQMNHLLKAMELAEEWYSSTSRIAGKILHSTWSAQQEELLTKIRSSSDGVTQQEIYRTFRARMQEKDIESSLKVLEKSELVRRIDERSRIRYIRVSRI